MASEKYWRTRRGEMMDPSIVTVKRALRSVVVAEIDILCDFLKFYLELFVFFSASVNVIVCILLLFLEPEVNVLAQGELNYCFLWKLLP